MTLPPERGLVILGCSRRKNPAAEPVAALELYQGGCVPPLRSRLGHHANLRARIRILSAQHGLLGPDDQVLPYEHRFTGLDEAYALRETVTGQLEPVLDGVTRALVVMEPLYYTTLAPLLALAQDVQVQWIPKPHGWAKTVEVLDEWGWP